MATFNATNLIITFGSSEVPFTIAEPEEVIDIDYELVEPKQLTA